MVEIGRQAAWSVSSAKTGHGLELLRDNDLDTYWQYVLYSFNLHIASSPTIMPPRKPTPPLPSLVFCFCFIPFARSDGPSPHVVNMQFEKRTSIRQVSFFRDKQDESYTPLRVSIRGGTNHQDLKELYSLDVEEATGWVNINLADISSK